MAEVCWRSPCPIPSSLQALFYESAMTCNFPMFEAGFDYSQGRLFKHKPLKIITTLLRKGDEQCIQKQKIIFLLILSLYFLRLCIVLTQKKKLLSFSFVLFRFVFKEEKSYPSELLCGQVINPIWGSGCLGFLADGRGVQRATQDGRQGGSSHRNY